MDRKTQPTMVSWAVQKRAERAVGRLAARFAAVGIPVVPVKGIALARLLYDDPAERPMLDADLLVPRHRFEDARAIVREAGWQVFYESREMGELCFFVDEFPIELHAEIGRPGITALTVEQVVARAVPDAEMFDFPVLRIDDADHVVLVATNLIKDMFVDAPPHLPEDLRRLVRRLRAPEDVVRRSQEARFATGMYLVARWMVDHGILDFEPVARELRPFRRTAYAACVRSVAYLRSRAASEQSAGGWSPAAIAAFVLACGTCDDTSIRRRCLGALARRMGRRALGLAADRAAGATPR